MVILSTSKTVFKSFCLYYTGCAYKTPYAVCSEFLPLSVKIGHKKKRQHSVCYTVCFFALANRLFLRMDFSNILMRSSRLSRLFTLDLFDFDCIGFAFFGFEFGKAFFTFTDILDCEL